MCIRDSREAEQFSTIYVDKGQNKVRLPSARMLISQIDFSKNRLSISKSPQVAMLDAHKVSFPLEIRRWKKGDYFYPYGLAKKHSDKVGKKKLSDFFTDLKLSLPEKEKTFVVCSEQRILWVAGHRIDDRFKITEKTRAVLKLKLELND